jgi:demethoxyubiquinone hydroxylase (CLK1/Coq7/Cat5 family)
MDDTGGLMGQQSPRQRLISILQAAYSGELAAAHAYRGHWKSLKNPGERECIRRIEDEEWIHREKVGRILGELQAGPARLREIKMLLIGRTIGMLCRLIGRFLPMYFAGRLESRNVGEYESAAFYARTLGLAEFASELRMMALVEKEHEVFFMNTVAGHRLLPLMRRIFGWG